MSINQFAMVKELAFLIKDNLPCKHLVLSMEETLVNSLQDDTSSDRILELEPMSPYNRLLLHRLADIFGFAHESVGEGDDRHLILERCPESSMPSILVSDILWQYDDYQSPTSHQLLKRKEALPVLETKPDSFRSSLEEREAAYLAARERIFSVDENEIKQSVSQKPRNVPVVARRMIAHALGQRINSSNDKVTLPTGMEYEGKTEKLNIQETSKVHTSLSLEASQETTLMTSHTLSSSDSKTCSRTTGRSQTSNSSQSERMMHKNPADKQSASVSVSKSGNSGRVACKENLKQEHIGAARRIFAHALGLQSTKENPALLLKCSETKPISRRE